MGFVYLFVVEGVAAVEGVEVEVPVVKEVVVALLFVSSLSTLSEALLIMLFRNERLVPTPALGFVRCGTRSVIGIRSGRNSSSTSTSTSTRTSASTSTSTSTSKINSSGTSTSISTSTGTSTSNISSRSSSISISRCSSRSSSSSCSSSYTRVKGLTVEFYFCCSSAQNTHEK